MRRKAIVPSLVLCVLLSTLAERSFSQAPGPRTPEEQQQWIREQQEKAEQQRLEHEQKQKAIQKEMRKVYDEYSDEAWQEALNATAEQWKAIKPRLEKVKKPEVPPALHLSVYGFGGSSSSYSDSYSNSSGGAGGTGTSGGFTSGGGGGFGGGTRSGGGGGGGHYSVHGSGNAQAGGGAGGGASGGQGGFSASGGSFGGGGGYGFGFGGPAGPIKKKVGEMNLGWQWQRPSLKKSPGPLSENEKTCEQLLDVLDTKNPNPEQVRQRVEALRKVREQIEAKRREARQQLREVVTPEQEAKLILMGYLD